MHYKNGKISFCEKTLLIFTPDYFFAKKFKPICKTEKSAYIKLMNHYNIWLALIVFLVCLAIPVKIVMLFIAILYISIDNYRNSIKKFSIILAILLFIEEFIYPIYPSKPILFFGTGFIGYRCISRSLEIIVSFYNDVCSSCKTSLLTSKDRVDLAIKSYIEVIVNYAIFYYLLGIVKVHFENSELLEMLYISKDNLEIIPSLFKSIGISTFSDVGSYGLDIFSSFHLFTSFVLVVFAIAGYISNIADENKEREVSKALLKDSLIPKEEKENLAEYLKSPEYNSLLKEIDEYLESDEYKILDKDYFILNDFKSYGEKIYKKFKKYDFKK